MTRKITLGLWLFLAATTVQAQGSYVKGQVKDKADGTLLQRASVRYQGAKSSVLTDELGNFRIAREEGRTLQITCVGYKTKTVKVSRGTEFVEARMEAEARTLGEVSVKARKRKYSRKDNPAVELMRRVIERKDRNRLEAHDYYRYDRYQKITFAVNDVDRFRRDSTRAKWYTDQIETSPLNDKNVMPLTVDETLSTRLYRKEPKKTQDLIKGRRTKGVNTLLQTGEMANGVLRELFKDVDLYDDFIMILKHEFTSPIGRTAISFYRFAIMDTVALDNDSCYHLLFYPNNHQDFGFQGELWVTKDESLRVRRCKLQIPNKSQVNYVRNMHLQLDYQPAENGEWCLASDDMWAEFRMYDFLPDVLVTRNTRRSNYNFTPFDEHEFKGKAAEYTYSMAQQRDDSFWQKNRKEELSKGEQNMDQFVERMLHTRNFGWVMLGLRALIENFAETGKEGTPSKFDIGPLNTIASYNFVDGLRIRAGGKTTAALNPHLFWSGYTAYGTKSRNLYYGSSLTYSLNKKEKNPLEFPRRNIEISSEKDVMSPSDKFIHNNKDNAFMAFRPKGVREMYFYHRQKLNLEYEARWGFRTSLGIKTEQNQVAAELHFIPVNGAPEVKKIRTTEITFGIGYCANTAFVDTKQNRVAINHDKPDLNLRHTTGVKHLIGGNYNLNLTEASLYKRQWLGSWGRIDMLVKAGAQWNKVPYPLLIMPPVNLSYFNHNETFSLMNNMEFLNDRYAFWSIAWNMNGKLFNRIPLLHHLKLREFIAVKGMCGHLTDKNNPRTRTNDPMLFQLPARTTTMNGQPYWETIVGIHNIFRMFGIEYVRRLTYTRNADIDKWGIRFQFDMTF